MITLNQMNLIDEIAGQTKAAQKRKEEAEQEMNVKLAVLEAEDEALMAWLDEIIEETSVEVLLDEVEHTEKPQAKEVGRITKVLPSNRVKVTIPQFANFIERGCSFKASVLTSTTKDSFVSSNIVALDIDNKESYTSIAQFMTQTKAAGLKPFMLYETFSSTSEHERYRVLYRFNRTITDAEEMEKLYNYVWSQFPQVDLDYSVDHSKILYGGKNVIFHNIEVNEMPDLSNVSFIKKKTVQKTAAKETNHTNTKHITKEEVKANLEALRPQFEGQIMNAKDINESIKLTDLLNVSINERFRCILPGHEDKHPSARIIIDKDSNEQVYICTCSASGNRVIGIWAKLFNISSVQALIDISNILGVSGYSEYQKRAREFLDVLYDNFEVLIDEKIKKYMDYHALTSIYLLLLRMARSKAVKPVSNNKNDIAIYASNNEIASMMKREGFRGYGEVNKKMALLSNSGIIRKLTIKEIDATTLNETKYNKHTDYYCILDLTDERMEEIKDRIEYLDKIGYRSRGTNAQREINALGYDYVRNNSRTQSYAKREDSEVLRAVASIIKSGAKYFNEDDVNRAIRNRNHRITKKQAEKLILDFLNGLVEPLNLERTRVNKTNRKLHKIDKKYKSNTVIYIVDKNNIELLDFISNI